MSEYPPPGTVWITLQVPHKDAWADKGVKTIWDHPVIAREYTDPETSDQKRARLLKQAANQVRRGASAFAPHGPKMHDLDAVRDGLLLLAEALEVEDE